MIKATCLIINVGAGVQSARALNSLFGSRAGVRMVNQVDDFLRGTDGSLDVGRLWRRFTSAAQRFLESEAGSVPAPRRGSLPRVRNYFDATQLSDEAVDVAIAKSIRRKSGARGTSSGQIPASADQVEFMLQKMTAWRRNVHAANPHLASLPANVKGTIIHSFVSKRMRGLDVAGLRVNERLNSPFLAPGTSQHISAATGVPYTYRIPDFRLQATTLDIKPQGTSLTGAQVDDFMSFGNTSDVRFINYYPF